MTEFVLADGTGRSGKFMLGSVVSGFERMEFMQEAVLLDNLLFMHRLGKVDLETCEVLLQTDLDMHAMYMAIGRNLNGRLQDASSIYNAPDPARFLSRALSQDRDALMQITAAEGNLPIFISHDALCNANIFFRIFPEAKMINILRHPLALIDSWLRLGWGSRWGTDPKSLPICFEKHGNPVPWFAVDWERDYSSMSEVDRVVYSIYSIFEKAKTEYSSCPSNIRNQILFITFEEMLTDPQQAISRTAAFLGRWPTNKMEAILGRERLPRKISEDSRQEILKQIQSSTSPWAQDILSRLIKEFEEYWRCLVTSK